MGNGYVVVECVFSGYYMQIEEFRLIEWWHIQNILF